MSNRILQIWPFLEIPIFEVHFSPWRSRDIKILRKSTETEIVWNFQKSAGFWDSTTGRSSYLASKLTTFDQQLVKFDPLGATQNHTTGSHRTNHVTLHRPLAHQPILGPYHTLSASGRPKTTQKTSIFRPFWALFNPSLFCPQNTPGCKFQILWGIYKPFSACSEQLSSWSLLLGDAPFSRGIKKLFE